MRRRTAVLGLCFCMVLTGLHSLAVGKGPRWTSPLLLGDHLFDMMFALLVFLYAMALGQRLTGRWPNLAGDPLSDGLATLGLGLGALSLAILGMGALHLYYSWAFVAVLCGATWWLRTELRTICVTGARSCEEWVHARLPTAPTLGQRSIVLVLALALATLWLDSTLPAGSGPVMEWDASTYHLVEGQMFLQAHAAIALPDVALANAPSGVEMLDLVGLAAHTDGLGKTMNVLFIVLLCAATFAVARKHGHLRSGWLAVIMLANVAWVVPEVPATINDFAAAALLVLGMNDALTWLERWASCHGTEPVDWRLLIRAGCLLGFSASFKLSNLPAAPAAALTIGLVMLFLGERPLIRRLTYAIIAGTIVVAATLLILSPWIIKSYLFFGHPFYPLAVAANGPATAAAGPSPGASNQVWTTIRSLVPVFTNALGPPSVLLLAAPVVLHSVGARGAQLFLLIGGAFWIWYVPLFAEPRYYIPIIALGAAVAAPSIVRVLEYIPIRFELAELPFVAYFVLHSLYILSLSSQQAVNDQAGAVAIGSVSRSSVLSTHIEPYVAEQWINEHTPDNAVIAVVNTAQGYYLTRTHLGNWYNERMLRLTAGGAVRTGEIASWCRAGAGYLLLSRGADISGSFNVPQKLDLTWLHLPRLHARLLFTANSVDVYAITPCSATL